MVGCRAILMIAASFILPPMPSSSCAQSGKCCKCTGNDGASFFYAIKRRYELLF